MRLPKAPHRTYGGSRTPLRHISLAGLAGGALLVVMTSGVPAPTVAVLALALTGMALVVLAWLALGSYSGHLPVRRIRVIGLSWCLPLLAARPLFSADVHSYVAQGVIAARGLDPYTLGPAGGLGWDSPVVEQVSHYWRDTPAPYGPAFVELSRIVAWLVGENFWASLALYRIIAFAGIALIAWALPRLATRMGVNPGAAMWVGLLNPLVLWHLVADAHNDGLMVGLILAGTEIVLSGLSRRRTLPRIAAGVVLLALAANIKVVAAAALCCVAVEVARGCARTGWGRVLVASAVLAAAAVVSAALALGTGLGFGWVHALGVPGSVASWLAPTIQLGTALGGLGTVAGLDVTAAATALTTRIGAAAGAVVEACVLWSVWRGRLHPLRGLALVFAVMLVFGPVVQPWYLLWTVVPLAAVVRSDRPRRLLAAATAVSAVLVPPVLGTPGELAAGYLLAALLIGALVLAAAGTRGRDEGNRWHVGRLHCRATAASVNASSSADRFESGVTCV